MQAFFVCQPVHISSEISLPLHFLGGFPEERPFSNRSRHRYAFSFASEHVCSYLWRRPCFGSTFVNLARNHCSVVRWGESSPVWTPTRECVTGNLRPIIPNPLPAEIRQPSGGGRKQAFFFSGWKGAPAVSSTATTLSDGSLPPSPLA